jgi:hypothetical protein
MNDPAYDIRPHTGGAPGYSAFIHTAADNSRQVTMAFSPLTDTGYELAANDALKMLLGPDARGEWDLPHSVGPTVSRN